MRYMYRLMLEKQSGEQLAPPFYYTRLYFGYFLAFSAALLRPEYKEDQGLLRPP